MLFKGATGARAMRALQHVHPLRVQSTHLASRSLAIASIGRNGTVSTESAPPATGKVLLLVRRFADRAASRPKSHTGRSTSTRKPRSTTAKTVTKTRVTTTKKAAKPKPKPKPKPKAKPKPKLKPKVKKVLTPEEKKQKDIKELKKRLLKPPKQLPATAWTVLVVEASKGTGSLVDSKAAAAKYRNLSSSEREGYNHKANENKGKNEEVYKQWVQSLPAADVKRANLAGRRLVTLGAKTRYFKLRDSRQPKGPRTAYIFFLKDRYASEDFAGVKLADAAKLIAREFRELAPWQKQKYLDAASQDRQRYQTEFKRVFS